jgi:hypothetical protein
MRIFPETLLDQTCENNTRAPQMGVVGDFLAGLS